VPEAEKPRRAAHREGEGSIEIALTSEPPGAEVCLADNRARLSVTNGPFNLEAGGHRKTLLRIASSS
jgi:hypothetical protein